MARYGSQTRLIRGRAIAARGDALPAVRAARTPPLGGWLRATLLASTALAGGGLPAAAQNATWLNAPTSANFNTAANWTPSAVPTGTAFFGASNITALSFSRDTSIGGWTFNAGAPAYTFNTAGNQLTFTGVGIQGGSATISNTEQLPGIPAVTFSNNSTAGSATISNTGPQAIVAFSNNSTAGTATISNTGLLAAATFTNSTAGAATIANTGQYAGVAFSNSTAGSATISNTGQSAEVSFSNNSTAGAANITNSATASLFFSNSSTAGSATIANNFVIFFSETSTAGSATIINNSNLVFYNASTAGSATIINNGTLTFRDTSTAASARITNNAAVIFEQASDSTYAGAMTGTGTLTKNGSGTLSLTAENTVGGGTTLNAGGLKLSAILNSDVTMNGGILSGAANIHGKLTQHGGEIAPGNSIGTITVVGPFIQNGGNLEIEVSAGGRSDRLKLAGPAGRATLNGGTLEVLVLPGAFAPGTTYTIVNTEAGVSGTFSGVTTNLVSAFLAPTLSYDANNVFLTIAQTAPFASAGRTGNQIAAAGGIESLRFGNSVYDAVLMSSAPQARQAFDALSGELHVSTAGVLVDDSRYVRGAVLGRLRQAPFDSTAGPLAALGIGGPSMNEIYAADLSVVGNAAPFSPPPASPLTFWAQGFGAWGKIDGNGNAANVDRNLGGAVVGADGRVGGGWRLGLAAGYSQSNISVDARQSPQRSRALILQFTAARASAPGTCAGAPPMRTIRSTPDARSRASVAPRPTTTAAPARCLATRLRVRARQGRH